MKQILTASTLFLALSGGMALAHTDPGAVLFPFSIDDFHSTVQGGGTAAEDQVATATPAGN